jgi:homogentisate 1,2-dioxygenase
VHGPQPGSVERAVAATRTEEVAVMMDAFGRLGLSDEARRLADPDYPYSWAQNH